MSDDVAKWHAWPMPRIVSPLLAFPLVAVVLLIVISTDAEYARPEAAFLLLRLLWLGDLLRGRVGGSGRRGGRRQTGVLDLWDGSFFPAAREDGGDRPEDAARCVDVAGGRRLRTAREILGIDHRLSRQPAGVVDDVGVFASFGRKLARHPADIGRYHAGRRLKPLRLLALGCGLHERRPKGNRHVGREAARQDGVRLIEADPDTCHQRWRKADEPGVVVIVRRSRLARGRQREAE